MQDRQLHQSATCPGITNHVAMPFPDFSLKSWSKQVASTHRMDEETFCCAQIHYRVGGRASPFEEDEESQEKPIDESSDPLVCVFYHAAKGLDKLMKSVNEDFHTKDAPRPLLN